MPTSTDVTIPHNIAPEFPDLCVVCESQPDSTARICTNSQNGLLVFMTPILYFFGWSRVEFPICSACKLRFYVQRWGRTVICWGVIISAVLWAMPQFAGWERLTRKIVVGIIAMLACLPYLLFEVFYPRSFDVTTGKQTRDYEFSSARYGIEFFELNHLNNPDADIEVTIG